MQNFTTEKSNLKTKNMTTIRSIVFICSLSLSSLVFALGDNIPNDVAAYMRSGRRRRKRERALGLRIGDRSPLNFHSRRPNILQDNKFLDKVIDLEENAKDPQNRNLGDGFDEAAFWDTYLLSGQVNSLSPTDAPYYAPTQPYPPPTAKPAETPTAPTDCKPICKYLF